MGDGISRCDCCHTITPADKLTGTLQPAGDFTVGLCRRCFKVAEDYCFPAIGRLQALVLQVKANEGRCAEMFHYQRCILAAGHPPAEHLYGNEAVETKPWVKPDRVKGIGAAIAAIKRRGWDQIEDANHERVLVEDLDADIDDNLLAQTQTYLVESDTVTRLEGGFRRGIIWTRYEPGPPPSAEDSAFFARAHRGRITLAMGTLRAELLLSLPGEGIEQQKVWELMDAIADAINEKINLSYYAAPSKPRRSR